MIKKVSTDKAPAAIGPYSQAKIAGGFLFASGQIAIDPATGAIDGEDIRTQTKRVSAATKRSGIIAHTLKTTSMTPRV